MNLYAKLQQRKDNPLRIGVIGAGKFGAMYIAQVPKTPGVHLVGIADLSPDNAKENLKRVGWPAAAYSAGSLDAALKEKRTHITEDWQALVAHPGIDIIIESTGNPPAAVEHALAAFANGKHVVMVTVEADAFCGPLLARKAAEAGVVSSLAYGDQPALICDLVDWARTAGFPVVAAGRGHKWLPHFGQSTPETVWGYYGLTPEQAKLGGLNPKMFNSFLDGSKPPIETTPVCKATRLTPPPEGLPYPPGPVDGEGGSTVVGRLMPPDDSLAHGYLPLGLAHGWKVLRPVAAGQPLRWSDVAVDANQTAVRVRREMESSFRERLRPAA